MGGRIREGHSWSLSKSACRRSIHHFLCSHFASSLFLFLFLSCFFSFRSRACSRVTVVKCMHWCLLSRPSCLHLNFFWCAVFCLCREGWNWFDCCIALIGWRWLVLVFFFFFCAVVVTFVLRMDGWIDWCDTHTWWLNRGWSCGRSCSFTVCLFFCFFF